MEYVVIGVVVTVLLVGVAVFLVVPGRRQDQSETDTTGRPGVDHSPGVDDDTTPPVEQRRRSVSDVPLPDTDIDDAVLDEMVSVPVERPEPAEGRLVRLRSRLAKSQSTLGRGLLSLLSRDRLDDDTWEEIEDTLLSADLGVEPTQELVERLRTRARVESLADAEQARSILREELVALVGADMDRRVRTDRHVSENRPAVVLVVGVNGTGKTTTVGKLARVLVAEDRDVVLAAADTFRAAAVDQLTTWGERVGVPTVRGDEGADPASVAFDAVKTGIESEADVVLVDTAGRLQTKANLMDELGKIKRVIERHGPVDEVLLVLDATTGQNGMAQARVFGEVVDVTGIVLTKLDGTAKGGIVVAVQRELGVPVKMVGLGEGADDLAPFDAEEFVDGLLE
ncbi:signal recognition particle-docking protein FtsY [Actinobacteria bacterium YIM 96077]|uniref:Signal recognition particle receptor FtsY n=1 Tax=Phytoactinopolyspora halophila TaxID=1981511 RepID=A0A329QVP4_9ACTN|nr:signal recognition particle-docking protein FtsY [Phytoactinopolyspora halophila]AYY12716.1 signal recognition particle-docking protein FtsY [Actinobacteria bacterium YIM 96077]RAW16490.1 signal recognition particle-docking protein FtsY [Phytoactinopolyspora halophila]